MLTDIMFLICNVITTPHFLLFTMWVALTIKIYLITLLIPKGLHTSSFKLPWLLLLLILIGSMMGDIAWISKLTRQIFLNWLPYGLHIFIVRLSWAFMIMQYQSLALFIESLTYKKYRLNAFQKIITFTSLCAALYFLYIAFFENSLTNEIERNTAMTNLSSHSPIELQIIRYVSLYLLSIVILPTLFFTFKNIKTEQLPKILKKQLIILITYMLCPFLIIECIIAMHHFQHQYNYESSILSISTLLISYSIFYCIQKVLGLRFLNFNKHLHAKQRSDFVDSFKEVLDQLSKVSSIQELSQITQAFFKKSFEIPLKKINLIVRNSNTKINFEQFHSIETFIEDFMNNHDSEMCETIKKSQILLYDELTFNNFYGETKSRSALINFLEKINADLFLPIYQKHKVIAYIVIEINARPNKLYSIVDHDEMLVFAKYLGNIINLLQNRNLDLLIQQEKELKEELYNKQKEIMQYKESMRSFLRVNNQKDIGIIFYKNRRFIFGNQAAKELIKVNLNVQEGHPLSKIIREVGNQVKEYKLPKNALFTDVDDKKLIISGVPNLEQNNVIITIYHPEISDIIKKQINLLKDPTKWDYLLYLETTKSGQLINQLIPGSGEILLNFKIDLLKIGLSNKALLLETSEEDLVAMVELLHHISLRETLHTINLHAPVKNNDYTIQFFGINPIFGIKSIEKALFEKLDTIGTLFIKNIHFLDRDTQEYLAEYLKTGYWRIFKSDQKIAGSLRIICSSNKNLVSLVEENKFSSDLYHELKKTSLIMPPLEALPESELHNLTEGFTAQAVKTQDFKNMLELNEKEKDKIIISRPMSLMGLKTKIQKLLIQKSKKHNIYEETQFEPIHENTDPELIQAARLGKHALRDEKIMMMLWSKFKNQNQIATFLGVNRSSVNRRCKAYNFE